MTAWRLIGLLLLGVTGGLAASSDFILGVDYSEPALPSIAQILTDSSGALRILSSVQNGNDQPPFPLPNLVTKLSADGSTILWQSALGFGAYAIAVDPAGDVYVIAAAQSGEISISVAKLNGDGSGIAWETPVDFLLPVYTTAITVDSQGRVYVAGTHATASSQGGVVRLTADGGVDYAVTLTGFLNSIAVDSSGAAFVAGYVSTQSQGTAGLIARLDPYGSVSFYSATLPGLNTAAVALAPNGDIVVLSAADGPYGQLQRFDSTGVPIFSKPITGVSAGYPPALALDPAGNAYVRGFSDLLYPVKNSLATCASEADFLSVYAADGSLLQTTYVPIPDINIVSPRIAVAPDSGVFMVDSTFAPGFAPTRSGPFPSVPAGPGASFLLHLSLNAGAPIMHLACLGNAATFNPQPPVAPGEMITLFGSGIGPQQGIETQATLQSPYPSQSAGVEVTFDGIPAPLLWVQDAQINLIAPWSIMPGQNTEVCVIYQGMPTNCLTWPVAQIAPAVFTTDAGSYAVALNEDGAMNSATNPAAPGTIVSVFATGLGPITPPQPDGSLVNFPLPANVYQIGVQVQIEYLFSSAPFVTPVEVIYAGPAPYLPAGESRIGFRVPPPTPGAFVVTSSASSSQATGFAIYRTDQ